MRTQGEHIRTLQRRVDFLKAREHRNSYDSAELGALEWALVNLPPAQQEPKIDIYRSFEQWKSGNVLEHGVPRTEHYSEAQLDLVEMGWNYGYDAGRAVEQALDKKAENARELGLDYEPAPVQQEPISLAGEGHELYQQLLEAGRELLRAVNEDEKWGCVGPGPTEIAWDKFSSLASHVCTGIDSPQPVQQEPVAYLCENAVGHKYFRWKKPSSTYKPIALYTSPPAQRTWVDLTPQNLNEIFKVANTGEGAVHLALKLIKEKNT